MPLADALSFVPGLATAAAEPVKDAAALRRLAEWCGRYSPWTAPDGTDGIKIEITGCAHLWGGEKALAADLFARLTRQGIASRIAIADTLGAAWACARFAEVPVILTSAETGTALAPLPVEALRLNPATAQGLRRVGLKRIGDLYAMPRAALVRRFGAAVAQRLDQALDNLPEPLSPMGETPTRRVRLSFAEPIADPADLALAAVRLAQDLVTRLGLEGTGARRLVLAFHRVDGRVERIVLGTARPSRDPHHLATLFKARLDTIDPGLGIEDMILAAFAVEPLDPEQIGFAGSLPDPIAGEGMGGGISALLDRLGNRLGLAAVSWIEAHESHIPERASVRVSVDDNESKAHFLPPLPLLVGGEGWGEGGQRSGLQSRPPQPPVPAGQARGLAAHGAPGPSLSPLTGGEGHAGRGWLIPPRPIRLFEPPQPVEASWLLPDDPPFRFIWRRRAHRVTRADGPERIAAEWWRPEASAAIDAIRDYYRVEDEEGRRFWLFRAGLPGGYPLRWYVHGIFA
jgi:protein ImuB